MKKILLLLLFTVCCHFLFAQKKDSTWVGSISGIVRDSVHNYVLRAATVAVYWEDSILLDYQLANNFGEYSLKKLPIGKRLRLVASYKGYGSKKIDFTLQVDRTDLKVDNINLERTKSDTMEEVIVRSTPPVRMNGDTLEFNADAFKLDKNAVVEDLLKKLPGIVVWGDGTITVNGREVSSLKVDGKPFIAGSTKIATQNISKDAVDKIQVYQQNRDPQNMLDSITEINVKLKKGKNFGHFGKLAAGGGSDKRYANDANINFFNAHTQLGLVGQMNNVNRAANNVRTLMENSTFKGVGASLEYQPDFSLPGKNISKELGGTFQHDFIDNPDYYQNNRLAGDYFFNDNLRNVNNRQTVILALGGDSTQKQLSQNSNDSKSIGHTFSANYNKKIRNNTWNGSTNYSYSTNENRTVQSSKTLNDVDILQSSNDILNSSSNSNENWQAKLELTHQKQSSAFPIQKKWSPDNYNLGYQYSQKVNNQNSVQQSRFQSVLDPSQDKTIERKYDNHLKSNTHRLSMGVDRLERVLFRSAPISLDFKNDVQIYSERKDNVISDLDTTTQQFRNNDYLSVHSRYHTFMTTPALNFGKSFYKGLTNRYSKNLSIQLSPKMQFFGQKNNSDHTIQNFYKDYLNFVPSATISYTNYQYGAFNETLSLNYTTTVNYATVDQLYPLVDSINSYYINLGNDKLKPTVNRQLSLAFSHQSWSSRNPFNYNVNVSGSAVQDAFVYSSFTDSLGRTTNYPINAGGARSLNFSGNLKKAFKFHAHQLQIQYNGDMSLSRNPNRVNDYWNVTNMWSHNNNLTLFYTLKDFLVTELKENYTYYRSLQKGLNNNRFSNSYSSTTFSASVNCGSRFTINSNITYNNTLSSGANSVNFTIWNANAIVRLLSGKNLECKFSALDLLHQNTSVINSGANNQISQSISNVLQQYFMLTIAYYPRKFGKK